MTGSGQSQPQVRPCITHFIHTPGGGGAEAMLQNLVARHDRQLWRCVVICLDGAAWPQVLAGFRAAGAEVHDLASPRFLSPRTWWRLWRALRAVRPALVQTWMHHADLIGGWVARLAGVRTVLWSLHCREIHRGPGESEARLQWLRSWLSFSSYWVPRRILSCSQVAAQDHQRELAYPAEKMRWLPNGIDTQRFQPDLAARAHVRAELQIPEKAPVIGYLGRFHEMKDLTTWLRAAALLQKQRPDAHFVLCGGLAAELEPLQQQLWQSLPRPDQLHFVRFRPDPQRLYAALDVFSLSSRTEACPMTLMEAMACGVPCVATDVGDCRFLLGALGLTVPVADAVALAQAWERTLSQPPTPQRLRAWAVENFDISVAAAAYERVYEEVLEL
jgi:glycosyltransferase involved in cell wall biosynthesis